MGGGAAESYLRKAQIVWNATARWATGLSRKRRIRMLMTAVDWLTIKEQVTLSTAVMTWKLINLRKPEILLEDIQITDDYRAILQQPRLQFTQDYYK